MRKTILVVMVMWRLQSMHLIRALRKTWKIMLRMKKTGEVEKVNEDEEENNFIFKDGVNPLGIVEDDAFADRVYRQLEEGRDYEALAEKKRKELADSRGTSSVKKARKEDIPGASMEEIMEATNYGMQRRRSRKSKKKGRRKGSKKKLSPEITRMLGEATIFYVNGKYQEAIPILGEILKQAPDVPDAYHRFGLVHAALGNEVEALTCYKIAAKLAPKDSVLWELLFEWFSKLGETHEAIYCLSRAISADPTNIVLKYARASLYEKRGDFEKAAASYEEIVQICPDEVKALKEGAKMYEECGQHERSVNILEDHLSDHLKCKSYQDLDSEHTRASF